MAYKPKPKPKPAPKKRALPPPPSRPQHAFIPTTAALVRALPSRLASGAVSGRPQNAYVPVTAALYRAMGGKIPVRNPAAGSTGDTAAERRAATQRRLELARQPMRWWAGDPRFRDLSIAERNMSGPAGWAYTSPFGTELTPEAAAQIAALNAGELPGSLPPAVAEILGISETDRRKYFEKYTDWSQLPQPEQGFGDGGGGGDGGETPVTWTETYKVEGAPAWWKGLTPSSVTPESSYISLMNSLIPFLSEEDQRTVASNVSRMADAFGGYSPATTRFLPPPSEMTTGLRNQFTSAARATRAIDTMNKMILSSGKEAKDYGPGYKYLQDVAAVLRDFGQIGAADVQTRRQQLQALSALDPLLSEGEGQQLGAFGSVARMLAQPFFSAGNIYKTTRQKSGATIFGAPNAQWF